MTKAVVRRALRPGRLVPPSAARLRSRCVQLAPGAVMPWHSTGRREELLLGLLGRVDVEYERAGRVVATTLARGASLFIPSSTRHCVRNRSSAAARYVYVTG